MTRILEVNVDDNGHGGVYSFVLNILENIDKRFQVDICSFEKFEKQANIDYIESFGGKVHLCVHSGNPIKKQIECFKGLSQVVKNGHYDAVHIHSDVAYKLFLYALGAKLGGAKRILIHSHSSGVEGRHRKIKLLLQHITKELLPFVADQYFACSQRAAEWMYPTSILKGKHFALINNGINTRKFKYNPIIRSEMRKKLGLEKNFIVGHIGRFSYQKNHLFLIDIFAELAKKNDNARLLLIGGYVGDPACLNETKEKVRNLQLKNKVIFMGERDDVPELMQAMDCFLLPSRFEGLPLVGIEAQASGLPCFFSDAITRELGITSLAHFISLNNTADRWADEIMKHDNILRKDMRQKITTAGYDIENEVKKIQQFYSK